MIGHVVFVVAFWMGCARASLLRSAVKVVKCKSDTAFLSPHTRMLAMTLVVVGLIAISSSILSPLHEYDSLKFHSEITKHRGVILMLAYWFSGALTYPSLVAMCYVVADRRYGRWVRTMGFVGAILWLISGLLIGFRGTLSRTLQLLIAFAVIKKHKALLVAAGLASILGLSLFTFLQSEMRVALYGRLDGATLAEKLGYVGRNFIEGLSSDTFQTAGYHTDLMRSLALRAQDVRNSVSLYHLQDTGKGAGLRPLCSALYFPIPRIVWPAKRPPGSVGNTNYESAMHIVQIQKGQPYYEMGPFLASAHAYWEGGWWGIVLLGFVTGVFWRILLDWCNSRGGLMGIIVALTFAASLMTNGSVTCLQPLYAFFPAFWSKVIVVLVLSLAISTILKHLGSRHALTTRERTSESYGSPVARTHAIHGKT